MIPTLSFLYSKFDEFNKRFFNNELPKISIKINKTKYDFGQFTYRNTRKGKIPVNISISKYYDLPEIEYCNTLIHEMIHYYIAYKNLAKWYEDSHGPTFQKLMNDITSNSEFTITILKNLKIEDRILSNKNKDFRVLRFEYKGLEYFCRVSPTMTMKRATEQFANVIHSNNIKLKKIYSSKNPRLDVMRLYIKKLGLTEFNESKIKEYELKEVA